MNTVGRVTSTARRALILLLVSLFAAAPIAGCGGSGGKSGEQHEADTGEQGGDRGEGEGSAALDKIPQGDRDAFIQLATAIGTLRARAAPVAVGQVDQLGPAAPIVAARGQVVALHPTDAGLLSVRRRLIPALGRFAEAPLSGLAARRAARVAIASADRIEAGLRRYSRTQPAIGGVIPD
jgi:hypothetical protein